MKRSPTIALMLLLVVAFALPGSASAATSPGIKPGSFFYFFDTTFEKIGLFFTFGSENKARKALEYADERLAEAEAVTDNAEAVKTAITNYESNIAFAEEKSKDVGDKEKAEALLTLIADNTSKHQEVLTAVLVKIPDEAKEAITRAIEASRKGHEEAMKKIAELKGEVEELKQEVAELKARDEEREKLIEEISKPKIGTTQKTTPAPTQIKPVIPKTSEGTSAPKPSTSPSPMKSNATGTTETPAQTQSKVTTPELELIVKPDPLILESVSITASVTSVKFEWQTNRLTESKVFISGGGFSSQIFSSESGLSTRHVTTITGLSGSTSYSYEIEAISSDSSLVKKTGNFMTASPPPPPPPAPSPQPSTPEVKKELKFYSAGCSTHQTHGILCNLEIQYFENTLESVNRKGASITLHSDDSGKFSTCDCNALGESSSPNLEGNPLTGNTYRSGYDGKPSGFFTYFPNTTSTSSLTAPNITVPHQARKITAVANGVTATVVVWWRTDQ